MDLDGVQIRKPENDKLCCTDYQEVDFNSPEWREILIALCSKDYLGSHDEMWWSWSRDHCVRTKQSVSSGVDFP